MTTMLQDIVDAKIEEFSDNDLFSGRDFEQGVKSIVEDMSFSVRVE